ncbi:MULTISPECIES: ABC transporter ATP-binding protein [Dehalobacter]|uniref:ATP-binding cassette domain-containing protein n=1 Tax=Dehalobacter restrictus TaxID=55583 RepID=A0A857DG44_9FIRM|nr:MULTISPECIES: ABC transporter ATP-binding protein [Dehalobacter]MCG1025537.1 ABC transporter ATP-binding protein [Dehalobacter sp.]MDJ0306140.1 ABC transporter ATP-binding protein [Dehalobacter sp.]QGZ99471.1 ATP-binding cassette domain-containing protein [Dehalobacter restrictus]
MNNVILAEKMDVGYEKTVVVENVDLRGIKGQLICLLGPNGAGKSTILRTLSGLLAPVSGTVYINGSDLKSIKKPELAKKLAVVLTEQVSLGLLTVFEIAAMGRFPHTNLIGKLSDEDKGIIQEALQAVNAVHLRDRYYAELSDGEKQKVMIARALIQQPELIVLDEPTSHLDVKHKVEVISILRRLCLEKGITVVLSLHDIDLAIKGCETILLIQDGKIAAQGTPEEIIKAGTIQSLYEIEGAQYNELLGSLEFFSRQYPEIFIAGGNGTGAGVYRALSRAGYGMCCGVLHSNDIDIHIGKALGCEIIEEEAFNAIHEDKYHQAREIMKTVDYMIDTGFPVGSINQRNMDLVIEAVKMGKTVFSLFPKEHAFKRYGEWTDKIRYCSKAAEVTKCIEDKKTMERV